MNLIEYEEEIKKEIKVVLDELGVANIEGWLKRKKSKKLRSGEVIAYHLGQLNIISELTKGEEE
tara:strand:- start:227 stop:418 length:192 start_codon:yes stop_codon:yes gene_type:complete